MSSPSDFRRFEWKRANEPRFFSIFFFYFLDLFSFFIPSYYSMPASIEKNDWTCGKEDLFEISVHRFETEMMSKGCSLLS